MNRVCALVVTAVLACACASDAPAAAPPPTEFTRGLEHSLHELMSLGDLPGLSLALVEDGRVMWTGCYGTTARGGGRPVDEDTVFEAASLSKTLFAYIVARLVDRGVIDLDRPLVEYAPYPRLSADPRHRLVTARMCLTHTTGLPNWGTSFVAEPGTRFTYSGVGIRFLRKTVETVTGAGLEELARKEVFVPLGLSQSSFLWRAEYDANRAAGHGRDGRPQPRKECPDGSAAASLMTTAGEFARFLVACLEGRGLSPAMHETMLSWQTSVAPATGTSVGSHVGWSLGWGRQRGGSGDLIWQWGDNGDSVAFVAGDPATDRGLVFMAKSGSGLSVIRPVLAAVFPGRSWCLEYLGYESFDSPRRVAWYGAEARRALAEGRWDHADHYLRRVLLLSPQDAWAREQLRRIGHAGRDAETRSEG